MTRVYATFVLAAALAACTTVRQPPIPTVAAVDLERFMGDWYVIAHIPAPLERRACNAVEHYEARPDGTIATTYTFRQGTSEGPLRQYHPTGLVRDPQNRSTWAMQFVWPLRSEYLIAALDADYHETIIARNARDYVWIMARTPSISEADYARLEHQVSALGYDVARLRKVPQRW